MNLPSIQKKTLKYLSNFKVLENDLISLPSWINNIAALCLLIYSLFAMTNEFVGGRGFRLVAFIGFVILLIFGKKLCKSRIFWLLLGAGCVPLISWIFSHISHPLWAEASPKIHRLTNWFAIIPIAVILGGRTKNVYIVWFLSLIGILFAPWLTGVGWQDFELGIQGVRRDFGLHNAQHAALLYGVFLLGLLVFAKRFFSVEGAYRWFLIPLWFFSLVECAVAVLITQTRGVWLGLIVSFLLCLPVFLFRRDRIILNNRNWLVVVIGAVLILSLFSLFKFSDIIESRMVAEHHSIESILKGDLQSLDSGSIGIRVKTWQVSWPWIKEHPLVGWGGEARRLIVDESELPMKFGHLHNSYLDILVTYGFFGLLLFFSLIGWLLYRAFRAWESGFLPGDLLLFFFLYIGYLLIVNCFESYMFFSSGTYIFNLVCGGVLTCIWRQQDTN